MSVSSNDPEDKVRELQRTLWRAAKQHRERRLHARYDRIYRGDGLWEAWKRVRSGRCDILVLRTPDAERSSVSRVLEKGTHG